MMGPQLVSVIKKPIRPENQKLNQTAEGRLGGMGAKPPKIEISGKKFQQPCLQVSFAQVALL